VLSLDQVLKGEASAGGAAFMADAYSFGVIIWEIYTGALPWAGMHPTQIIFVVTVEKRLLSIPAQSPPEITALLLACWERDPTLRPTMAKIECDFPEQEEDRVHSRAAAFSQGPPASAYTLSSQLTLSSATTPSARTSQVRGCGLAPLASAPWDSWYGVSPMG